MYHLNRYKYLTLIIIINIFIPIISVNAIVQPTNNFYVNDYANILSLETEEYIIEKSLAINNVDGTQIVVVTVPNLEGRTIEDYALNLFRNFGIGDRENNNGLLLLLALEEREFRVEVGIGLEGILPDGKTGRFQDKYIIPFLKNNDWDNGIKNGYDAFYSEIVKLNELDLNYNTPIEESLNEESYNAVYLVIIVLLNFIIGTRIRKSKKNMKNTKIYIGIVIVLIIIFNKTFLSSLLIIGLITFILTRFPIHDIA